MDLSPGQLIGRALLLDAFNGLTRFGSVALPGDGGGNGGHWLILVGPSGPEQSAPC